LYLAVPKSKLLKLQYNEFKVIFVLKLEIMRTTELNILFTQLINLPAETECVEFKEAKQSYDFGKLGKYFSALSNEANLKGKTSAWLIFGVKDKPIDTQNYSWKRISS
jgi:hypothetical protein